MFDLQQTVMEKFDTLEEVFRFVSEEKKHVARLPLKEFWESGARFHGDGYLGIGSNSFGFNPIGFGALNKMVGISDRALLKLEAPELASNVLNDLFGQELSVSGKASNSDIIIDENAGTVIGIVSRQYLGYSNDAFLRDVLICLDEDNNGALFPTTGDLVFKSAYSINSQLFLRLSTKSVKGVVSGRGGTSDDVSEIGIEATNTMAGGHAVRLSSYVFRLICANGLVAQVSGSTGRVIHTGSNVSFRERISSSTNGLLSDLGRTKKMIETLGGIEFAPRQLARFADLKSLFSIVPNRDLKREAFERARGKGYGEHSSEDRKLSRLTDAISQIPFCLDGVEARSVFSSYWRDGATMYDFINVFTEHAKSLPIDQKIKTETNAGALAVWISKNKRRFA